MASELQRAVEVVDERIAASVAGGFEIEYQVFFARMLSGHDLRPGEVCGVASDAAARALAAVEEGEEPPGAIAQAFVRGLAVGLELAALRARAVAEARAS